MRRQLVATMARCPACQASLPLRIVWSGFTLAQAERGRIICPKCGAELEVRPASAAAQVPFVVLAGVIGARSIVRDSSHALVNFAMLLLFLAFVAIGSYLFLSRFRARKSLSLGQPRGLNRS